MDGGDGPRFGAMIGLVAALVATVILVFFGIGYALGRPLRRRPPPPRRLHARSAEPGESRLATDRPARLGAVHGCPGRLWHRERRAQSRRQPAAAVPCRHLARARLLDVRGRPSARRGPMLVACATAASLFPFIGTIVYMIVRPPVSGGRARARARDRGRPGAPRRPRAARLPVPRLRGRAGVPALPGAPAPAEGALHGLWKAA